VRWVQDRVRRAARSPGLTLIRNRIGREARLGGLLRAGDPGPTALPAPSVRPRDRRSVSSVPLWWICPGGEGGISPQRHKGHRAARVQPSAPALTEGTHRLTRRDLREPLAYGAMSWGFGSGLRPSPPNGRADIAPETGRSLNDSSGEPVPQSTLTGVACSLIVLAKGGSTPGADRPPASLASGPPWRRPGRHVRSMVTSGGVRCSPAGRPGSGGWCPGPGSTGPRPARGSGTDARPRARRRGQPRRPPPR